MILDRMFQKKEKPLLSYIQSVSTNPYFHDYVQLQKKTRMSYLYFRSPESQTVIDGHASDICGTYHFEPLGKSSTGKTRVMRAEKFDTRIEYGKIRKAMVRDALVTGEGFGYISELSKEQIRMLFREFNQYMPLDSEYLRARSVCPIDSRTMAVQHNQFQKTGYVQSLFATNGILTQEKVYDLKQIMHLTFDVPSGKVEGWTPLFSLPLHLELIWLLWSNQYDFQEKGNHPDLVVLAEKLRANSPEYKQLDNTLQAYNSPGNSKHGTLLLTGDKFQLQQLERMDTLQFKEVDMFVMSLIASVFHYPQNRLPFKTEQAAKDKDTSGGKEQFYYSIVDQKQKILNDLENSMLWEPYFGVRLVQNKNYKHDEIQEVTVQQIKLGNMNTVMQMLNAHGKKLSVDKLLQLYNGHSPEIHVDDLEDGNLDTAITTTMNNQLSRDKISNAGMSESERDMKRQDELKRQRDDGTSNGITR